MRFIKIPTDLHQHRTFLFYLSEKILTQSRDGLQVKEIAHGSCLIEIVWHHVNPGHLAAARPEGSVRAVVADKDNLAALVLFELRRARDDGRCECFAMRTVIRSNEDSNVIVELGIESLLNGNERIAGGLLRGFFLVTILLLVFEDVGAKETTSPVARITCEGRGLRIRHGDGLGYVGCLFAFDVCTRSAVACAC